MVRANLKELDQWLQNPPPGAEQIINGNTPYKRVKSLRKKAETRVRQRQMSIYTEMHGENAQSVRDHIEVLEELLVAVQSLRSDLRQGKADPEEVMDQVTDSMRGLRDVTEEAKSIEESGIAATAMVDKDPADWEEGTFRRFPAGGRGAEVSVGFLRGEEESPFADLDRGGA